MYQGNKNDKSSKKNMKRDKNCHRQKHFMPVVLIITLYFVVSIAKPSDRYVIAT